jgi:hypothetical protein
MNEQGIVVFAPHDGFVVVQHSTGFTVIEIIDDETGIGCGNELHASSWEGLGSDTLYSSKGAYQAMFWGSYDQLADAQEKALGRVDKRDSQTAQVLIQGCSLGSSHGPWGFVGCGVGIDRAAAAA